MRYCGFGGMERRVNEAEVVVAIFERKLEFTDFH